MKNTKHILKLKQEVENVFSDVIHELNNIAPFAIKEVPIQWHEIIRMRVRNLFRPIWLFMFSIIFGFLDSITSVLDELNE